MYLVSCASPRRTPNAKAHFQFGPRANRHNAKSVSTKNSVTPMSVVTNEPCAMTVGSVNQSSAVRQAAAGPNIWRAQRARDNPVATERRITMQRPSKKSLS